MADETGSASSIACATTASGVDACVTNDDRGTTLEGPPTARFTIDGGPPQTLEELCKQAVGAASSIVLDEQGRSSEPYLTCSFPNGIQGKGGAGRE